MTLLRRQFLHLATSTSRLFACSCFGLLSLVLPAPAQAADFKGETVTIQIGFGPGGGYDTYARVLARHFGRFIPGNPTVVPKNMPGAGSLRAANHIYNLTARDGIEIGTFSASTAMEPMMGNDQAKFDTSKFGWIGSMNQDIAFCGVWRGQDIPTSFPEMLKKGAKELIFGSAGPAAVTHQHALILRNVLGANIRVISGYQGQKEVNLAMQRGEVHGVCGLFTSAIKVQSLSDVQAGRLKLFLQMGPKVTNEFGEVPDVFEFVKTDEDRKVLELHFKQTILGRPFAASPSLPKDRTRRAAPRIRRNDERSRVRGGRQEVQSRYRYCDRGRGRAAIEQFRQLSEARHRPGEDRDRPIATPPPPCSHHRARRRGSRSPPACRPSCAGCRRATAPSR